jgi:hypothetical protein
MLLSNNKLPQSNAIDIIDHRTSWQPHLSSRLSPTCIAAFPSLMYTAVNKRVLLVNRNNRLERLNANDAAADDNTSHYTCHTWNKRQ